VCVATGTLLVIKVDMVVNPVPSGHTSTVSVAMIVVVYSTEVVLLGAGVVASALISVLVLEAAVVGLVIARVCVVTGTLVVYPVLSVVVVYSTEVVVPYGAVT
jgi:hypothetical protein